MSFSKRLHDKYGKQASKIKGDDLVVYNYLASLADNATAEKPIAEVAPKAKKSAEKPIRAKPKWGKS